MVWELIKINPARINILLYSASYCYVINRDYKNKERLEEKNIITEFNVQ